MTPACFGYRVVGWLKGQARAPLKGSEHAACADPIIPDEIVHPLMILWVALHMAHNAGGFKVIHAGMVSEAENSTEDEGLAARLAVRFRSPCTGTLCRKISQIGDFAHYLDRLPLKHTFF